MRSLSYVFLVPLMLIIGEPLYGQPSTTTQRKEDSLLTIVHSSDIDTIIVQQYIKLCDLYNYNDSKKAIEYARQAITLAQKSGYPLGLAKGYERQASAYFQLGDNTEAAASYLKAREANKKAGNYEIEASVLYNLGNIQYELGHYDSSTVYAEEAGRVFLSHDDSIGYGVTLYMISGNYGSTGNYELAIKTILESLGIFQRKQAKVWEIYALDKLVEMYNVQKKYDESLAILKTNLDYHRKADNAKFMAITYRMMGDIYLDMKAYDDARTVLDSSFYINDSHGFKQEKIKTMYSQGRLEYETHHFDNALTLYQEGLKLSFELNDALFKCSNYLGIGKCLYEQKKFALAIQNLQQSVRLAGSIDNTEKLRDGYLFLSKNYEALHQPAMALENYKSYKQFSDSITAQKNKQQFAELNAKYETEKKEQQITLLQQENDTAQVSRRRVIALWILTIVVGGLFVAILILGWWKNKQLLAGEKELDKIKSRFFANISHEFRTPLTLILGPLHDLLKKKDSAPFRTELQMIEKHAKRLLTLINQILDLSKLDAGKYQLNIVRADVVATMKRTVSSFHSLAEIKHIDLSFDTDTPALEMNFDPENLETVINNLMSNAFKFEPEGGQIKVILMTKETVKSAQISLTVTNKGSYITSEARSQIFNRFFQAETDQDTGQGTGIGLALIHELVELHGGSIRVESSEDEGTRFIILLPTDCPHSPPHTKDVSQTPVSLYRGDQYPDRFAYPAEEVKGGNVPVILVVEDHEEVMHYIHSVLGNDYRIEDAGNGKEGIERAKGVIPDIIISDVMMPEKDGVQLTHELKNNELTSHIPIILLTAKASVESRLEGLDAKADDYLTKPFNSDELKLRVRNILEARNKLREKYSKELIIKPQNLVVKSLDEAFIEKVCRTIEENLDNEYFSVEDLSRNIGLSRSQLHRKLDAITAKTASQFIREYRLERARELIEKNAGTIAEISFRVGFSSPGYFNKCFKEYFNMTPGELRNDPDLHTS